MFSLETYNGNETNISYRIAGDGPPLLLLHGFPQTNMMWHKIAPALAEKYTVVAADLRGYGDSGHPASDAAHAPYSKRAMAADMAGLMRGLGHDSFMVAGHDRGGRVAHRLARDHGDCVSRIAVMDIAPTAAMYGQTDMRFATAYYHWFFLIQPAPLPEQMIGADPEFYLRSKCGQWGRTEGAITDEAFADYLRCFRRQETITPCARIIAPRPPSTSSMMPPIPMPGWPCRSSQSGARLDLSAAITTSLRNGRRWRRTCPGPPCRAGITVPKKRRTRHLPR